MGRIISDQDCARILEEVQVEGLEKLVNKKGELVLDRKTPTFLKVYEAIEASSYIQQFQSTEQIIENGRDHLIERISGDINRERQRFPAANAYSVAHLRAPHDSYSMHDWTYTLTFFKIELETAEKD